MGYAIPEYPLRHAGAAIVLGSAPCAGADLAAARVRRPSAALMVVNDAARFIRADHIVSLHHHQLEAWLRDQLERFGARPTVHTAERLRRDERREDFPAIDYWWVGAHNGATSAWAAARIARMMGFDEVVLAGCPMRGGDGYCVEATRNEDTKSFGHAAADDPMVLRYRRRLAEYVAEGDGAGITSMSGYTRELLGAPA